MNRFRILTATCVAVAFLAAACTDLPTDAPGTLAPEAAPVLSLSEIDDLETTGLALIALKGQSVPSGFADVIASYGGTITASYPAIGVVVAEGLTDDAAAAIQARNDVFGVSPDYVLPLVLPDDIVAAELDGDQITNDNPETAFFFPRQWNMRAIGADVAWAAGFTGSPDITVAILDTGLGYTHPDLAGLVDLSRSASFVPSDDALVQASFPGAHPIADLHWHGTHVGATVSSNAFAAAGVTSKTTLIGAKVCNVNGSCPTSGVLAGVMFAADQGAQLANLSVGGLFLKGANPGFVAIINRAYTYAFRNGTLIVTSAGNATADLDRNIVPLPTNIPLALRTPTHLPSLFASFCNAPNVVCVSATGPTASAGLNGPWQNVDAPTTYTNFGRSAITVAAPGGTGPGLIWAACSRFSLQFPICQTGTFVLGAGGTSMASPHAAGVGALLAANGARNPAQIASGIARTADDLVRGQDPFYGRGRINAATAVGAN
jgi:lantibiotic leader peptide-processing serine protease